MRVFPLVLMLCTTGASAQWVVEGILAEIPIVDDCTRTEGDFARMSSNTKGQWILHTCKATIARIDATTPDASHFFLVRQYTFRAMDTDSEEAADVWAAVALALAPNAAHYLNAAIAYLHTRALAGDPARPGGSTPMERIQDIQAAAAQVNTGLKWDAASVRFR